jgi:hypothetical protein
MKGRVRYKRPVRAVELAEGEIILAGRIFTTATKGLNPKGGEAAEHSLKHRRRQEV